MNFKDALEKLNIEDYSERIWHSNSHGELFHLSDYIFIAESIRPERIDAFRPWFQKVVAWAEKEWSRPESIFQHILKIIEGKQETD